VTALSRDDVVAVIERLTRDANPAVSVIGPSDNVMSNEHLKGLLA
jgi:hypothetical protein